MAGFASRIKHAWNAFLNQDPLGQNQAWTGNFGVTTNMRPDRTRLPYTNERSILTSILTRMTIDAASIDLRHVRLDEQGRYSDDIQSGLNNCLTIEANIDQAAQAFKLDIVMSLLSQGAIAIVPVDTTIDPQKSTGFDIQTLRVGEVTAWYPRHVRVRLYNDNRGEQQEITLEKRICSIVENPLYAVMNEPSSTLQRIIRKLNMLDVVDEQSSSGKLDLIIQLPYVIKSEARRDQAEKRRKDIEFQLKGSQYGIAYTDGTEKVTQLNRPAENNLLAQVQYLIEMLYGQLGITADVMNGTADESVMLNYYNRTINPILTAVVEAMKRSFLTKTARTQGQSIMFFRDPFKLVPLGGDHGMADIADKLARNEILTSNEIRGAIGFRPSKDPKADQLVNSNMPQPGDGTIAPAVDTTQNPNGGVTPDTQVMAQSFDSIDSAIDDAFNNLGLDEGSANEVA